ncbi:MAG: HU family DNA-binding protein [Patescibacteria group bacterium]
MTKQDLVTAMATSAKISKVAATAALDAFVATVTNALKKAKAGETAVTLTGFGSFKKLYREARTRNSFGKNVKVPAHNVVKFVVGKSLKEVVK